MRQSEPLQALTLAQLPSQHSQKYHGEALEWLMEIQGLTGWKVQWVRAGALVSDTLMGTPALLVTGPRHSLPEPLCLFED